MAMASGAIAAAETAVAGNRPVAGKTAAASTVGQQTAEAVSGVPACFEKLIL